MRIGIVGLGLIGGSLGLALRALSHSVEVVGVARTPEGAAAAMQRGAVDVATAEHTMLRDCDIVVIATPIDAVRRALEQVAAAVPGRTVMTDVASVKMPVIEWAGRAMRRERFLGGHPVAGKAESGLGAADPGIFRGEPWIFTPLKDQPLEPFAPWLELVTAIGARPVYLSAQEHDRQMGYLSHLAFTVSAAFARTVDEHADHRLGGPGYRSMVRLATGDASMYDDIARENRGALLQALDQFAQTLQHYRERIASAEHLQGLFESGKHVAV
jgi:prephenate dehydrogenase